MPTRRLTTLDATLLVMGGILGVGIFFTPQIVAERAFEPWAFLTVWVIGGLFALAAAMTFAEWGASFPRAGGWYVFLRESLGRFPAFLFAWIVLFVVSTGAIASVAGFAALSIDRAFTGVDLGEYRIWISIALITAVTATCLAGVKNTALFQNAIMLVKLTAVAALLVAGLLLAAPIETIATIPTPAPDRGSLATGMAGALLPVLFAYGGWQMVCYIAPQVENPGRALPRAIVGGVVGVIVIYLLLALAYLRVLGIDGIASDPGFVTTLTRHVLGERGEMLLSLGLAISALGFLVVTILGTPWLYVAMAQERLFLPSFADLSRTGVPARGLALQWAISIAYLFVELDFLVDAVVFAEWVFHGLVAWGLMRFRRTNPNAARPFRSPFYPLAPMIYLIAAIVVVPSRILDGDLETVGLGVAVLAIGSAVYGLWMRRQ